MSGMGYRLRDSGPTHLSWSHGGTDACLPEIDSDTIPDATAHAVRLLELERIGLRPPTAERVPTLAEIAAFSAQVDRQGGPGACHHHAYKTVTVAGAQRKVRYVAFYIAEGHWPANHLTTSCGSDRCCNRAHLVHVHAVEDIGVAPLPPEEVAKFLGISQARLDALCRRILARKTITPRGLDLLVQAHTAMGGKLP